MRKHSPTRTRGVGPLIALSLICALALVGASGALARSRAVPAASAAPVLVGTATEGSRLAVSTGTWTGSPAGYTYRWQRCTPGCAPIAGATASTYALVGADVGSTIEATATASNAVGYASADSNQSAVVAAAPAGAPGSTRSPWIGGTARQGARLSAATGSWSGPPSGYAYRWLRCDTTGAGCTPIASATTHAYTTTKADVGSTIRLEVTATNAAGSSSAVSAQSRAVAAAAPPKNTKVPSISGTPLDNHTLTARPGRWSGDGPITFGFQWQRCDSRGQNCNPLKGETGKKYEVRSTDAGSTLRVLVSATNAAGTNSEASDAVLVQEPARPRSTSRPSISGSTVVGNVLTADRGDWTGTAPITYSYRWERCDGNGDHCDAIGGADGSTYGTTASDLGHRLRVRIVARNAVGTGDRTSSATQAIRATVPVGTARPVIGGALQQGSTLTATSGTWSSATSLAFSYQWARCDSSGNDCVPIPAATQSIYLLGAADVGHRLIVQVKAQNASGSAYANSRPTAVVAGPTVPAPANTSPPAIAGNARQGNTLTASTGAWSNAGSASFSYQWARCDAGGRDCAPIANATRATYVPVAADVGHRLIVQVRVQTGGGVAYANSAPTAAVQAVAAFRPPSTVPVAAVALPDRLVIDRVAFTPARIRSRQEPLVARFHVSETRGGRPVAGALVYAVGVPFNRLSKAPEATTDASGWATITFQVRPTFPLQRGYLVVILVRARKPGGSVLAGVSARRFASVRVG